MVWKKKWKPNIAEKNDYIEKLKEKKILKYFYN